MAKTVSHPDVKVIRWDRSWGSVTQQAMRDLLEAQGYTVSLYCYPEGTYFPPHTHPLQKRDGVLEGKLKVSWQGGSVILEPGDVVEIPAGVLHSAEVVGKQTVVSLDATRNRPR